MASFQHFAQMIAHRIHYELSTITFAEHGLYVHLRLQIKFPQGYQLK